MKKLNRIGVLSLAKFQGLMMAGMGLLLGLMFGATSSLLGGLVSQSGQDLGAMAGAGWLLALILPVVYGVMGFVMGAIGAFIYNLVAKVVGGIEIEIKD
jgi:hypothetical protein